MDSLTRTANQKGKGREMPRGVYNRTVVRTMRSLGVKGALRNNPGELMKNCRFCQRSFHHQGIAPHERACAKKTSEERAIYLQKAGRYTWKTLRGEHEVAVPARVRLLKAALPIKGRGKNLPAPNTIIEADGQRFAVTLSFDQNTIRDVAARLLGNVKLEGFGIK